MAIKRRANAVWKGGLKDGKGKLDAPSGALADVAYGFRTRFEDEPGTNPEELIAAAHAGCFSMALSGQLEKGGFTPESIETKATVTMEKREPGMTITAIHLEVEARVPDATQSGFEQAANAAKTTCPVSRLLGNIDITMDAKLVGGR